MPLLETGQALRRQRDRKYKNMDHDLNSPLVSVVITTYKRAALVPRAIKSALNQTVQDIEVIVVDDASPDDTECVVREISDLRVRYIRHEQNRGPSAARNTGIRAARGEFIAFLDDDDEWLREKTEKQLRHMRDYSVDAVVGMGLIDGKLAAGQHDTPFVTLADLRKGQTWGLCTLVAKAHVVREVMFDEVLSVGEDWDVFVRICQTFKMGHVNEPLYLYHQVGESAASERILSTAQAQTPAQLEARAAVLQKHREFLGNRQFKYQLAGTLLTYIGTRAHKWSYIRYAIKRCGIVAVMVMLLSRAGWHLKQLRSAGLSNNSGH